MHPRRVACRTQLDRHDAVGCAGEKLPIVRHEQHRLGSLAQLVAALKIKAKFNDGMASRYQAAQTRLKRFEDAGPPEERPPAQAVKMRLRGARTGNSRTVFTVFMQRIRVRYKEN